MRWIGRYDTTLLQSRAGLGQNQLQNRPKMDPKGLEMAQNVPKLGSPPGTCMVEYSQSSPAAKSIKFPEKSHWHRC